MRQQTASLSQPEPVIIYDSRSTPLVLHGFHLFEKSPSNPIELKYGYTRVYPNSDGFVPYPQNFGRVIPVYPLFGYTRVYPYFSPGLFTRNGLKTVADASYTAPRTLNYSMIQIAIEYVQAGRRSWRIVLQIMVCLVSWLEVVSTHGAQYRLNTFKHCQAIVR